MKTKLNINVNISLMLLNLIGIVICFFLTSRDFYYAVETFFGLHTGESKTLFFISAFGFEAGIVIYTIGKKHDENEWQDYVFMVASCAVNTIYLCWSSYTKNGLQIAPLIAAVVLGCVFPLIVLWLSVQLRERFWTTVGLKESQFHETLLSEELTAKNVELKQEKQKKEVEIQKLETEKRQLEKDKIAYEKLNQLENQAKNTLVQQNKDLVQKENTLVQQNKDLVQRENALVQQNKDLVQRENALVQQDKDLVQKENTLVQQNKDLVQKENTLVQQNKDLVQKENALVQKATSSQDAAKFQEEKRKLDLEIQRLASETERQKGVKATFEITDNIELQSNLLRNWKRNKDTNETLANDALADYKSLIENSIVLIYPNL